MLGVLRVLARHIESARQLGSAEVGLLPLATLERELIFERLYSPLELAAPYGVHRYGVHNYGELRYGLQLL